MNSAFRDEFPFFAHRPDLAYLDNASTAQKPRAVLEAMTNALVCSSNTGRGSYQLAGEVAVLVEQTRQEVASFLHGDAEGVCFTSGATESLNTVVWGWALEHLQPGDEVLLCESDHKAAVAPWQELARRRGITLVPYRVTPSGDADIANVRRLLSPRTKVLALTHIHNVFGERASVADFRAAVGSDVAISLDAAQSVGHTPVRAYELGADFVSFSAHKMFGPPGVGVLWVAPRMRPAFQGVRFGAGVGESTGAVSEVVEVGTLNLVGIAGLRAALRFHKEMDAQWLQNCLARQTHRMIDALADLPRVELLAGVAMSACGNSGYGIVSFRVEDMDAADIGFVLDDAGVCVRTGSHCTQDNRLTGNSVRLSTHAYTTDEEIDRALQVIGRMCR